MYYILELLFVIFTLITTCTSTDPDAIMFPSEEDRGISPRMNYHHHHHHHADVDEQMTKRPFSSNTKEIPLDLIKKLNQVDDISQLLSKYVEGEEVVEELGIASRFGGSERTAAVVAKPAACIPTLQTVELKSTNDTSLFYFPPCTRVERCGGCCSHSLLSCQPVQTETISYQVYVSQYVGGTKLNFKGKEIVLIDKHTKCKCDCIMKKEDCNSFQEYKKDECQCVCANLDERKKCDKFNETKLWDPNICKCRCRSFGGCSTGLYFDNNKCSCVPVPVRRRFAELFSNSEQRSFTDQESDTVDGLAVAPLTPSKLHNDDE